MDDLQSMIYKNQLLKKVSKDDLCKLSINV
jgi:hypothetical protein